MYKLHYKSAINVDNAELKSWRDRVRISELGYFSFIVFNEITRLAIVPNIGIQGHRRPDGIPIPFYSSISSSSSSSSPASSAAAS